MSTSGLEHLTPKRKPDAGTDFFSRVTPDYSVKAMEDHTAYALDLGDLAIQLVDGKPIDHYVPAKWLETAIPLLIPTLLGSPTVDIIPGITVNTDPASLPTVTIDSQTPKLEGAVGTGAVGTKARDIKASALNFISDHFAIPELDHLIENQTRTTTVPQLKIKGITINIDPTLFPRDKMNNPLLLLLDTLEPKVNKVILDEIVLENKPDSDELVLASPPQLRIFTPAGQATGYENLFAIALSLADPQKNVKQAAQAAVDKAAGMLTRPTRNITHAGIKIRGDPQNRPELSGLLFAITTK